MKIKIFTILSALLAFVACTDLNLNPLSEGSSVNWYADQTEIEMSLSNLYRTDYWPVDDDAWTDDWTFRGLTNPITDGTITGTWSSVITLWSNHYKAIAGANTILDNLDKSKGTIPQNLLNQYAGDARFNRATQYAKLISKWGDVVYFTSNLDLQESFNMKRTDKNIILKSIYEDYDYAASNLPLSYGSSQNKRATKGAALAMKARIALYMGDYATARDASKACMDLGIYQLYPDFRNLFLSSGKNCSEIIFAIPRSVELGTYISTPSYLPRNLGGYIQLDPSWELLCSFLCTDGLPIDESPLFNPHEPFRNRDPRCAKTIVEFQTNHLGIMYQPHPDSLTCYNFKTGKYIKNNDTRANAQYASYNALAWKKWIDDSWADDFKADPDIIIIRYADVLLMYAEAKIELNETDASVLSAINQVRARAYGVNFNMTSAFPAITSTNQAELRKSVRIERRMEFAWEGLRYTDIIRWKLAEKVLNIPNYGILDVAELRTKVVKPGLWFFPSTPQIDNDGVADFSTMYNAGLIKLLGFRTFYSNKQYLWPIPAKEILINPSLVQNPNY